MANKPHWMTLPRGGKSLGVGPTGPGKPLVEIGIDAEGRWLADYGGGTEVIPADKGVGLLLDLSTHYRAGLTIHGEAKLREIKKAGEAVLNPPRREVW